MGVKFHYNDVLSSNPGTILISGRFACNGTSDPTVVIGNGYTVTRVGVGRFKISFSPQSGPWTGIFADIQAGSGGTTNRVVWSLHNGNVIIETQSSSGTAADLDGPYVSFLFCVSYSSIVRT